MKWLLLAIALGATLVAQGAERVVTVGGDVTQIVYALGAQAELVGRDSTSQRPALATKLPDVGYMRQLNAEGILALHPTLVLVSELAKPSQVLTQLERAGVKVVTVTGKNSLNAIPQKIATISAALQRSEEGEALTANLAKKQAALPKSLLPVRVLFVLSHSGMSSMAAGNDTAADGAIRAAGLINAMGNVPHYQTLSQEGIIAAAPQLVVVGKAGIKNLGSEGNIWQLPGMALTPAGKQHRLLVVDEMALLGFGIDTPDAIVKLRQAAEAVAHDE